AAMLDVSAYADVMRHVAQQRNALLFDRLAIMQYWNDNGTFDLYAATKKYDMARRVHECISRALASLINTAAHLDAVRMQTTRQCLQNKQNGPAAGRPSLRLFFWRFSFWPPPTLRGPRWAGPRRRHGP